MNEIKDMTIIEHDDIEYLCFEVLYKEYKEVKFIPIGTANKELANIFYDTLYGDDNE